MRKLLAICALFSVAAPAFAADAPHVRQRIVPGQSIGKVVLGMSLAQVRKALGRPESVIETRELGFDKTWIEYSWNFTEWRVAFVNGRVVRVGTSARTEKTKEGIGVGTLQARVERAFAIDCRWGYDPDDSRQWGRSWCIVAGRGGVRTAFVAEARCEKRLPYQQCAPGGYGPSVVQDVYVFAAGEKLPVRFRE
jgi:hypothetical protein